MILDGLWPARGAFGGPPWKPWGLPGGAKGGCQKVFAGLICVLEGLSVVAGAALGPERSPLPLMTAPWGFILAPCLIHFATFLRLSPFFLCSEQQLYKIKKLNTHGKNKKTVKHVAAKQETQIRSGRVTYGREQQRKRITWSTS